MKVIFFAIFYLTTTAVSQDSGKNIITVFYFGGTDCGYCTDSSNIFRINKLRDELPQQRKDLSFKFVLVVMDEDVRQGIEYSKHYPNWNELSVGSFYNNELMIQHVNSTKIPGVPHIMVYRDYFNYSEDNIPILAKRNLIVELVGATAIKNWINEGYPIKNKN